MTALVRDLPPWLAAVLPGLRGARLLTPAAAELPPAMRAATITTPANPIPTGLAPQVFAGASAPRFRRTLPDVMPSIPMSGGLLQVPQINAGPNGAQSHPEGQPKLQADLTFAGVTAKAASIATYVTITDELLDDAAGLEAWLNAYLGYLVKVSEERALLLGNGVPATTNIVGFFNAGCAPYDGDGMSPAAILTGMIAQSAASGIYPDTAVLGLNMFSALFSSASAGAGTFDEDSQTFAGCDLIVTPVLADGYALVGPCQSMAVIGREGGTIVEGTRSHASDFVSNKAAIRAASRLALGILMPKAFVIKVA